MRIVWTEPQWLVPGLAVLGLTAIWLFFGYRRRTSMPAGLRWLAAGLKLAGLALLLAFLLQPKVVTTVKRPGLNHWAILQDTSASMTLKDQDDGLTRGDRLKQIMEPGSAWQSRLAKDFMVDAYRFDSRLHASKPGTPPVFDGTGSALGLALGELRDRYRGRPLAGILVLTDGSPTDSVDGIQGLPPVFPLVIAPQQPVRDLAIANLTAQATLFEDAPLIVDATVSNRGMEGQAFVVTVREPGGKSLGQQRHVVAPGETSTVLRFQVQPETQGTVFLQAEVALENPEQLREVTLENNTRLAAADRENGPYRVLYVGGRPSFEHKFLQRALAEDSAVRLTSLIRIARREPKFDYRSRQGERSNPLYRGFGEQEQAERFDEPVFIRLNTRAPSELSSGFPKTAAELFPFDTVILDAVESAFFDREQQRLLQRYVSERGGSVIMLGGAESLDTGDYQGTLIGEMLPVTLDPPTPPGSPVAGTFQLTREGRLEPWARLRQTEEEEARRIEAMPLFPNIHKLPGIRPGATEIGRVETDTGTGPALAVRRYGRGRTAAFAIAGFWQWGLADEAAHRDMDKAWRQLTRWLLADVPRPLSVKAQADPADATTERIIIETLGDDFQPGETGGVQLRIRRPDASWVRIASHPHPSKAGALEAQYASTAAGTYLAEATLPVTADKPALTARSGWVVNALQDEYLATQPDLPAMERLAAATRGRVIAPDGLDAFVASLANLPLPLTETRSDPLWTHPACLLAALACFIGEWSLRRWKRLA